MSDQLGLDFERRPMARAMDPATSHQAARRALAFRQGHAARILEAVRDRPGSTAAQIAEATGLTVVQVDRRRVELRRAGLVDVIGAIDGFGRWWPGRRGQG